MVMTTLVMYVYICYCNLGWESDNDGQVDTVCGDVDECYAGSSIDHAFDTNPACSDTYGFFDCFCNLGWESDNDGHSDTFSVAFDKCDATSSLDNFCDVNSACSNTAGS